MKKFFLFTVLIGILTASFSVSAARPLDLRPGTMMLGGEVSFSSDKFIPEEGDTVSGKVITFSPYFGYFVAPNFAVTANLSYVNFDGDAYSATPDLFAIGFGTMFMQRLIAFYLYVGFDVGYHRTMPEEGDASGGLYIGGNVGLMFPLNRHVAINTSIRLNYQMNDDTADLLSLTIGYFGLTAFF